jgi:predicted O-methyltransferase YrrM
MPNFTADWHSHNIPHWRRILEPYRGQPGVRALEIGSFEGRSTVWLLENILTHETAQIDCIDTFEGSVEHMGMGLDLRGLLGRFLDNIEPYKEKVRWIRGQSQWVLRADRWTLGRFAPGEYDFIYVDGSHKAADVLEDAVLSFRLLKVGGLMIFDDYIWNGGGPTEFDNPKRGIEAFYIAYGNQLKPEHVSYQAIFQKVDAFRVEQGSRLVGLQEMVSRLAS